MEDTLLRGQEPKALKYWTLVEHLRSQIVEGQLSPGDRVSSAAEMRVEFQVSRATVEKAFTLLEQDGLLTREQGRGTFVAPFESWRQADARDSKSTGMIGLLVLTGNPYSPYILHLLAGIRKEAQQVGLEVIWLDKGETIPWSKIDGILMYLGNEEPVALGFPADMPCVSVLRHKSGVANVLADDSGGIELATRHLLDLGHQRIACLFSSPDDAFSQRRLAGYHAALQKAGVSPDADWVHYIYDHLSKNYLANGEACMSRWLEQDWSDSGCTALLAANDEAAIGIIKALAEKGLRVPEDVSVVGFDGAEVSEYSTPRLTTIEVPLREIGAQGMRLLWEQIQNGITEPQNVILPTRLKIGASTAAPCRTEQLVTQN